MILVLSRTPSPLRTFQRQDHLAPLPCAIIIPMTLTAYFRFHGDLVPLLPPDQQGGYFAYPFQGRQSAKHLVEARRVPHTEVGELRIDDQTISLDALVQDGERVDVYPCTPPPAPEPDPRFILDNHLGRLAAHLRMLGFDCL